MDGIALPLTLTIAFVLINGFFVAAEFALVKAQHSKISLLAAKGSKRAKVALHLFENMDLYLSGCQLGITIASLVLGWLAEPAVARLFLMGAEAVGIHIPESLAHIIALVVALTVVTGLHMVFGEQAPKIWAIHTADKTTVAFAYPLRIFVAALRPLIWLINEASNLVLKATGINTGLGEETTHNVAEIRSIVARSASAGFLTLRQSEFAQNILGLVDLQVRHVVVPRADIITLKVSASKEENLKTIKETQHSRFPLCEEGMDSVIGVVHAKDVLMALLGDEEPDLKEIARPAVFVPETQNLSKLIIELKESHAGCAVVVDERGTAVGLAFLDDGLEEIVGPIRDEFDRGTEPEKIETPKEGEYILAGSTDLPEARELLKLEGAKGADTIGGFVISKLGRLPRRGDKITIAPYKVTVLGVRRHHISRIRFELAEEKKPQEEPSPKQKKSHH